MGDLYLYNTLSRKKEKFTPIHANKVGLYVCGPTLYGDAHLGHARPAITYDVLVRYFRYLGYQVRYVRNITDVGHLENDADEGEDKVAKKAKLENLEPMEVVQGYTLKYHEAMRLLNTLPPSIEPRASGHIIEQIELAKDILEKGFAYISNGSLYFDVEKYDKVYKYGILSGRNLEDTLVNTRNLDGQDDKRSPLDFALWKKATPAHIMKWPSPWSVGYPGWHLECSAMSAKYLGEEFDIHGGGMDLLFPHHECELAQNCASRGRGGVRYWMHNNMITIDGQKMGKSLGNFIYLSEFFAGSHKLLAKSYSPMAIRFFMLQAHYRSTLDFSNDALSAAEKGLKRVMNAVKDLDRIVASSVNDNPEIAKIVKGVEEAMNDDLNTPIALAMVFDGVRLINQAKEGALKINENDKLRLEEIFFRFVPDVLGLMDEMSDDSKELLDGLIQMLITIRKEVKEKKDYATADAIRDRLNALGITIKDTKDGAEWSI